MTLTSPTDNSATLAATVSTNAQVAEQHPPEPETEIPGQSDDTEHNRNGDAINGDVQPPPNPEINRFWNRISDRPETKSDSEATAEKDDVTSTIKNSNKESVTQEKETSFDWMVLLCAFGSNITFGMDFNSFSVFYPYLVEYFEATAAQVGWCLSIEAFVTSILSIFSIIPIERFGCRPSGVIGSLIFCIGISITSLAPSLTVVYFTYGIIAGIGASICGLTSSIIIQQRFHNNRALVSGVSVVGFSVGGIVGPAIANVLLQQFGWRGSYLIFGAIYSHRIAFALLFVTPPRYLKQRNSRPESSSHRTAKDFAISVTRYLRQTFDFSILRRQKLFTLYTSALCVQIIVMTGYVQHCVNRAVHIGIAREQAFWASSLVGLSNTVSRIAVSFISNLSCINRCLLFAFGLFMSVIAITVLLFSSSFVGTMTSAAIFGIMFGCTGTIVTVIVVDLVGVDLLTRCLAIQAFIFGFFRLSASPFVGWIYDETKNYNVAFALLGCLGFIDSCVMIFVYLLQRRHKQKANQEERLEKRTVENEPVTKLQQQLKQLPVMAVSASNHELSHC